MYIQPKVNMEYFSNTPYSGFQRHVTAENAQSAVNGDLEYARRIALDEGYDVSVEEFCCGKITHDVREDTSDQAGIEVLFSVMSFTLQEMKTDE